MARLDAQTVAGDRFTMNAGPCTMRSGSGAPASTLGKICDTYVDSTTGIVWQRQASGWLVPGGLGGSGTANRVARFVTTTTIGNAAILDDATNVTMDPAGDVILNPVGRDVYSANPYATNLGLLNSKFLQLHAAELWVETLVAQQTMATIGGRVLIAPSNILTRDLNTTDTTIYVKYNNFEVTVGGTRWGSQLYLESNGKFETMQVGTAAAVAQPDGSFAYVVTRNTDGSGANSWFAGDAVVSHGGIDVTGAANGGGIIDLYSLSGINAPTRIGPTISGNIRTVAAGTPSSVPRWAVGNLNGIYGYSASTYGAAFGVPNAARITVDDTNGIRMYDGTNIARVLITPAGTATFSGDGNGVTNINGGNIQTGTVAANKITAGNTRNQLRNGECRVQAADDWLVGNGDITGITIGQAFAPWNLNGENGTCMFHGVAAVNGSFRNITYAQSFPVIPGLRYEVSGYIGSHRSSNRLWLTVRNAAGADLTYDNGQYSAACTDANGNGGTSLSSFCRAWMISNPMPATAATVIVMLQVTATAADVYAFFTRMQFAEAKPEQREFSEWSPAGLTEITGGMMRTDSVDTRILAADAVTANNIQAGAVTAGKIQAGSISGTEIAAGSITADKLNVTTLSAITANAGTITAGTINGVNINGTNITGSNFSGGTININSGQFQVFSSGATNITNLAVLSTQTVQTQLRLNWLAGSGNRAIGVNAAGDIILCPGVCGYAPAPAADAARLDELERRIADIELTLPARRQ